MILLLFLMNLRVTVITLLAIPLSVLVAVLTLKLLGATINTMRLGGMAIAIGALIDDAIIDVENVFRRLRENSRLEPSLRQNPVLVTLKASLDVGLRMQKRSKEEFLAELRSLDLPALLERAVRENPDPKPNASPLVSPRRERSRPSCFFKPIPFQRRRGIGDSRQVAHRRRVESAAGI